MARLRDISVAAKRVGAWKLVVRIWNQVLEDDLLTLGAALAYTWLFAIFPFLVFLLSLVPLLPSDYKPKIKEEIGTFISDRLPKEQAEPINAQISKLIDPSKTTTLLSFSLLFAVWAASAGMARTMFAMDRAYDIEKNCRSFYWRRVMAIILTLIVATLLVLVFILMPIGSGVLRWLSKKPEFLQWLSGKPELPHWFLIIANIVRYLLALVFMFTVLWIIYHYGPSARQPFALVTPGAAFSVIVWLLLGWGFKLYLVEFRGAENYQRTYGAVAGAAILLLQFYLSALVLLIGAEINSEIDNAIGVPRKC